MATVILARHGRTGANAAGVLAGRAAGVALDVVGRRQARDAAERLADVRLAAAVTSPMRRCRETARLLLTEDHPEVEVETGINECDYGEWSGRSLKELADEPLWRVVQRTPSTAVFPGGEAMRDMSTRAVAAVRDRDQRIAAAHGDDAVWLLVSHGDVIKAILADALGMHLDLFQRIAVDPASLSMIRYAEGRSAVLAMNTRAGPIAPLVHHSPADPGAAAVGGGAGPDEPEP